MLASTSLLFPGPLQAAKVTAPGHNIKAIKAGPVGNLNARFPTDPVACDIIYEGEVLPGDTLALRKAYAELVPNEEALKHGFQSLLPMLCLRSGGGSVQEGILISRFVREAGIATVVEDGQMCASMCAVIFLAGTSRMMWLGSTEDKLEFPRRFLHPRGRLMFHSPYLNLNKISEEKFLELLTKPGSGGVRANFAEMYRSGLRDAQSIIETFTGYSQASYRVGQPWVRQSLLLEKMANDSREWVCVDTVDAVGRWDIDVFGYQAPAAPTNDQIYNMCHSAYHWRQDLFAAVSFARPSNLSVASPAPDKRMLPLRRVYYNSLQMQCVIENWPKRAGDLDQRTSVNIHFQTDKGERVSEPVEAAPFAFSPPSTLLHDLPGVRPRENPKKLATARAMTSHPDARMQGCSYRALPQMTVETCRSMCASDGWCEGYSFNKITRSCELKHDLTALRFDPLWESGVPKELGEGEPSLRAMTLQEHPHERSGTTGSTYDVAVLDGDQLPPVVASNAQICALSCAESDTCVAATFETKGPACRHFSTVTGAKVLTFPNNSNDSGISWVKRQ